MYIIQIASECAPVAKVGGLGDVIFGLSRELEIRGNSVEIILPKYDACGTTKFMTCEWPTRTCGCPGTTKPFIAASISATFTDASAFSSNRTPTRISSSAGFLRAGDDDQRFAFFCRASLEFILKSKKYPDIIHVHDWQTALVPVLLYEIYQRIGMSHPRVCFTLHNLRHQGVTRSTSCAPRD